MAETITTRCCIAGGGPAGMILGFLLARAGLDVVVLEKHKDFLRDFRGDTIHPSTLELMHELGLLAEFLKLPHEKAEVLSGRYGSFPVTIADFRHLPTHSKFIALMPQWDFLNFLAAHGRRYPGFRLLMEAEAKELIEEGGRVAGVRATTPDGPLEIRSTLVVGCDGRHSTVRDKAGLAVETLGAPMDVLWFRLSHKADDSQRTGGVFLPGRIFVTINRGDACAVSSRCSTAPSKLRAPCCFDSEASARGPLSSPGASSSRTLQSRFCRRYRESFGSRQTKGAQCLGWSEISNSSKRKRLRIGRAHSSSSHGSQRCSSSRRYGRTSKALPRKRTGFFVRCVTVTSARRLPSCIGNPGATGRLRHSPRKRACRARYLRRDSGSS